MTKLTTLLFWSTLHIQCWGGFSTPVTNTGLPQTLLLTSFWTYFSFPWWLHPSSWFYIFTQIDNLTAQLVALLGWLNSVPRFNIRKTHLPTKCASSYFQQILLFSLLSFWTRKKWIHYLFKLYLNSDHSLLFPLLLPHSGQNCFLTFKFCVLKKPPWFH
jgi:hypothetical protein